MCHVCVCENYNAIDLLLLNQDTAEEKEIWSEKATISKAETSIIKGPNLQVSTLNIISEINLNLSFLFSRYISYLSF